MTRRVASEEERILFREALKHAKPLAKRRATAPAKAAAPAPKISPALKAPPRSAQKLSQETPRITGHREAHLRRGRLEPQARLDLHGHRQEQAFQALQIFLFGARASGQRIVLVITGKSGVLRENVPRWLATAELRTLVSGIAPAHVRHGGAGAFYISLRKKEVR